MSRLPAIRLRRLTEWFETLPMTMNLGAVSLAEGLRAGIAVALTVIAGSLFNLPLFGLAALGALLTCFADPGGPIARRVPAVLTFAVLSGIAYGGFGLLRGLGPWVAAPAAGLMIFCASYARVYGLSGLQVGNLLSVVTVLALDQPIVSLDQAVRQGLNLSAGACWAALLTLVLWQIHPYAPGRSALAEVCTRLSRLARELAVLAEAAESQAAFDAHAGLHRRLVREAIETARGLTFATLRRGVLSRRAGQLAVRLQALEQMFAALIALSEILENDPASRAGAARPIRLIGGWLAALGPDIIADRPLDQPKKRASLQRLRATFAHLPAESAERHVLEALAESLAVLINVSMPEGGRLSGSGSALSLSFQVFSPLLQNFSFGAATLRHAARAAVIATPVLAWTMISPARFAHWATITLVLCLQPYFSATWQRSAERIAGTVLGGVLAALIGLLAQSRTALALTMLPLTTFAFAIRGVSFGAFIAVLTPMIVLLVEQIAPGANELTIALDRVGYTLLGGTLAVLGNRLLWPGFESTRLQGAVAAAVAAHVAYIQAVFDLLLDGVPNANRPDAARRAAGMASNNLEASLSRALLEPHRGRDAQIARAAMVDAALRRMAGRLAVLALDRPVIPPAQRPVWLAWRDWLAENLGNRPTVRPVLPAGDSAEMLTRLARQLELIAPADTKPLGATTDMVHMDAI